MTLIEIIEFILIVIIADKQLIIRPRYRFGYRIHKYYPKGWRFQVCRFDKQIGEDNFGFDLELFGFDYGRNLGN